MIAPLIELTGSVVRDLTEFGFYQDNIDYLFKEIGGREIAVGVEVVYISNIIAN
ncbi:hypothetical protein [Mucilaginibacter rubeus]|uniref:hypothetical protein n=1 Tax=Mucilaginibacter rubeus TaxID=2027860 RepID=UPI001680FB13|nr:hypothetical protein [Mucilaginibacter rubeus]